MVIHSDNNGYLFQGNYLDLHKKLVENSKFVDGIITSPPYNTARVVKTERAIDNYENRYGKYDDNKTVEQYINWSVKLFNSFNEILKKDGCICYNISYSSENIDKASTMWHVISKIMLETEFTLADVIYWKKGSALPNNVSKNKITRIIEPIFIFCRKSEFKTFNSNKKIKSRSKTNQAYYHNVMNYIEAKNNDETTKINKATYSSELVEKLIDIYFKENSIILDPFNGTGTTSIACINKSCKYIGSEIDEKQIEHTIDRIQNLK